MFRQGDQAGKLKRSTMCQVCAIQGSVHTVIKAGVVKHLGRAVCLDYALYFLLGKCLMIDFPPVQLSEILVDKIAFVYCNVMMKLFIQINIC